MSEREELLDEEQKNSLKIENEESIISLQVAYDNFMNAFNTYFESLSNYFDELFIPIVEGVWIIAKKFDQTIEERSIILEDMVEQNPYMGVDKDEKPDILVK